MPAEIRAAPLGLDGCHGTCSQAVGLVVLHKSWRSVAGRWQCFLPGPDQRAWVRQLAIPLPEDALECAEPLRWLALDLWANGRRRLRDQQFEDALLRAYRVLELVGQFRLCLQGIHSDDIPQEHPVVQQFQARLAKKRQDPLNLHDGKLKAARYQVARLLKRFGDPLAQKLIDLGAKGTVSAESRNNSALIHGFEAASGSDPQPLKDLYGWLEELLIEEGADEARQRLEIASWLDFTRSDNLA